MRKNILVHTLMPTECVIKLMHLLHNSKTRFIINAMHRSELKKKPLIERIRNFAIKQCEFQLKKEIKSLYHR